MMAGQWTDDILRKDSIKGNGFVHSLIILEFISGVLINISTIELDVRDIQNADTDLLQIDWSMF